MRIFKANVVELTNGEFAIRKKVFGFEIFLDFHDFPGKRNWRFKSSQWMYCCAVDKERAQRVFNKLGERKVKKNAEYKVKKVII